MLRIKDILEFLSLPHVTIHLMHEKTLDNDPFYARVVKQFYDETQTLHPKFLFAARRYEHGFALCRLPEQFGTYFMRIEASARRNYKKAQKLGYHCERILYNSHLEDIRDVWLSTPVRQGTPLPHNMRQGMIRPIPDPPSRTPYHDYPYFGVFRNGKLYAYAGCLIMGDMCTITIVYGHADYLEDGVVPMLMIDIVRELLKSYPQVIYYSYGTYYGASQSMRRFKRKFLFAPHRVTWQLESNPAPTAAVPEIAEMGRN